MHRVPKLPCPAMVLATALLAGGIARAQSRDLPLIHWQHSVWTGASGPPIAGSHYLNRSADGYLWLSARNGLLRFDGVRFTVFDSTMSSVLRTKQRGAFTPLWLDRSGNLWIAAPGKRRIIYGDGQFRDTLTIDDDMDGPFGEDDRGLRWKKKGLPYRLENGKWVAETLPASLPVKDVWTVDHDTGSGYWIGTREHGLWHMSATGQTRQFGNGELRLVIQSRDGTVWGLGDGVQGTARLEGNRWIPLRRPGDSAHVTSRFAYEDPDGWTWFQTNAQGLVRYRSGHLESLTPKEGLSDDHVNDVHLDPSGAVWVSTDEGLDRLRPGAFAALDPAHLVAGVPGVEAEPDVRGGMWVTTRAGSAVLRLDGGLLGNIPGGLRARRVDVAGDEPIHAVKASPHGGVWVKPLQTALIYLAPNGTRHTFGERTGMPTIRMNSGIATSDGAFWPELTRGFGRIRSGTFKPIAIPGIDKPRMYVYLEDDAGRLWISLNDEPTIVVFRGDSLVKKLAMPTTTPLEYLALEHGDTLWATAGDSLFRIIDDRVAAVTMPALRTILSSNPAMAIANGFLWVSSQDGIARVDLSALHRAADGDSTSVAVQRYDKLDGLPSSRASTTNPHSVFKSPDGRLWINTSEGLAVAVPRSRGAAEPPPPRVLIEETAIDGKVVSSATGIPARPGRLDIHFTATGVELPERARLQYRLDGADKAWINATVPRVASYSHLGPGHYTFRVRSLNDVGVPEKETTLVVRVPPAWDQTWWFAALAVCGIAGSAAAAAAFWQQRRGRSEARQARARFEATLAERTRVARELHDTLLGDMAGLGMQLNAGAKRAAAGADNSTIAELLTTLSKQLQQSLVDARVAVTQMRTAQAGDAGLLHERLEANARRTFAGSGITARVAHSGTPRPFSPKVENEIAGIATEAMNNSRRHSNCRTVTVTCAYSRAGVRVSVRDDGCGFDAAAAPPSGHWGLIGMRERAAALGATFTIDSTPRAGTDAVLVIQER